MHAQCNHYRIRVGPIYTSSKCKWHPWSGGGDVFSPAYMFDTEQADDLYDAYLKKNFHGQQVSINIKLESVIFPPVVLFPKRIIFKN